MADQENQRSYMEIEDELNNALGKIGEKQEEPELTMEEKVATLTVQEMLEQMRIDEFEKMYITAAARWKFSNK